MDTITLVDEMIEDGRRLIGQLAREDIPVVMACWVRPVEEDRWSLYIATPLRDEHGAVRAYREVYRVLRSLELQWVTDSDVSLVGRDDPITRDVLDIMRRFPGRLSTLSRRPELGGLAVGETYVYSAADCEGKVLRPSFTVEYFRKMNADEWNAKTTKGEVIRTGAKGAVAYSTAQFEGEPSADVKYAAVLVLLETNPRFAKSDIEGDEELLLTLARQANLMADQMFKRYHPDAVILRGED